MTEPAPLAIVLDALAPPRDAALAAGLGEEGDAALTGALRARALAWARAAGGGAAPLELATAPEVVAAAAERDARGDGPIVLVAPDVPALAAHHFDAVRSDLAAGVLLSTAATGDGTPFLVALAGSDPALLGLVGAPFNELLATAAGQGRELGMIRAERRLSTLSDAHALLADPLAPADLAALLAPLRAAPTV